MAADTSKPNPQSFERLSGSQIRLLRLDSVSEDGQTESIITVRLEVFDVDSPNLPEFTALSYAWGSEERPNQISISRRHSDVTESLNITTNLHQILRVIASNKSSLASQGLASLMSRPCAALFWIDAICIDQADSIEKSSQVKLMAQIYRKASLTIMWIGEDTSNRGETMKWFNKVAVMDQDVFNKMLRDQTALSLFDETAWNTFCDLVVESYFRRRWVIEEAALSLDPWIVCGNQVLRWNTFAVGFDRICGTLFMLADQENPARKFTDVESLVAIQKFRARLQIGRSTTLLEALTRLRRCDTVKARDRIFAVLGLCAAEETKHIQLVYDKSMTIESLFKQQVVAHVKAWKNLDVLCVCSSGVRRPPVKSKHQDSTGLWHLPDLPGWPVPVYLPNLPTWVPNWTSPRATWKLGPQRYAVDAIWQPRFNACLSTKAEVLDLDMAAQNNKLCVRGTQVDIVDAIEPTTPPDHPTQRDPKSQCYLNCWALSWKDRHVTRTPYKSEAERLDALWRTITLGCREAGSDQIYSMQYIRYFCHRFFTSPGPQATFSQILALPRYTDCTPTAAQMEQFEDMDRFDRTRWRPETHDEFIRSEPNLNHFPHYRFFVTEAGRLGMGPADTQVGDKICILYGCSSPILLTASLENDQELTVRGEAYVDGFMWGEGMTMLREGRYSERTFTLI